MVIKGQVYRSNRSNKEYYRVVDVKNDIVNAAFFDFNPPKWENQKSEHIKEKHVDLFLPYFEEAFTLRTEEELAMKLLSRM